jgi:hypothetical protein
VRECRLQQTNASNLVATVLPRTSTAKKLYFWSKKNCDVTQMGDAARVGKLTLGATSKEEPLSGCPLRPTRHLEESRSFPYRTMGMSGISFYGPKKSEFFVAYHQYW